MPEEFKFIDNVLYARYGQANGFFEWKEIGNNAVIINNELIMPRKPARDARGRFRKRPAGIPVAIKVEPVAVASKVVPKKEESLLTILPANTRYVEEDKDGIHILIEQKPGIIEFHSYHPDYNRNSYNVAMPWQYFWLHFKRAAYNNFGINFNFMGGQIFWAQDRIISLDSPAYIPPLPNVAQQSRDVYSRCGLGTFCLGYGGDHIGDHAKLDKNATVFSVAEEIANTFYDSVFSTAIRWNIPFINPKTWESESKKNPYGWMDWKETAGATMVPIRTLLKPRHGKEGGGY